jgi:hypothetical protein
MEWLVSITQLHCQEYRYSQVCVRPEQLQYHARNVGKTNHPLSVREVEATKCDIIILPSQ